MADVAEFTLASLVELMGLFVGWLIDPGRPLGDTQANARHSDTRVLGLPWIVGPASRYVNADVTEQVCPSCDGLFGGIVDHIAAVKAQHMASSTRPMLADA